MCQTRSANDEQRTHLRDLVEQVCVNAAGTVLAAVIVYVLAALGGLVRVHTSQVLVVAGWPFALASAWTARAYPERSLKWWSTKEPNLLGLLLAALSLACFVAASQLGS
jgi:hypothetical protein